MKPATTTTSFPKRHDRSLQESRTRIMEGGSLSGYCAMFRDISDRLRVRDELSEMLRVRTRELDEARLEAFSRLALAAEYRDDETRDHTRRMGEISAALAERVGLDPARVEVIRKVAPLHDLGKIGISDSILLKPGKLTEAEFATMKQHARIGAEILAGSDSPLFLLAAEIAASHHERWDGSGYPHGSVGHEIPIAARIVGLVDVFDALTHARPYKAAWPLEDALAELRRSSGTHFDPRLIAAFEELDHPTLLRDCGHQSSTGLSEAAWETLNHPRPSVGFGDEQAIAMAFRDSSRAILIADDQRCYVNGNRAACKLLGISAEELLSKRIDDFALPEVRPHLDAAWNDFLRVGTQTARFTLLNANGREVTVQFTALADFVPGFHLSMLEPNNDAGPPIVPAARDAPTALSRVG